MRSGTPASSPAGAAASRRRGAIIGAGNVAINGHLPAWNGRETRPLQPAGRRRSEVAIVAGVESDPIRRLQVAERFPDIEWVDSIDHLDGIDFVDICTPPSTHAALIRKALRRGFHVLCEKPLVTRIEDLGDISKSDRVVYTVDNWRNAPILAKATELVRAGAIGDVQRVTWTVLRNGPSVTVAKNNWRLDAALSGGGIAVDHGWHALYVLHDWIGAAPTAVRSTLESRLPNALTVEDTATLHLQYPHASAEVFLTWAAQERRNLATIEGTRGAIRIDGDRLDVNGHETRFPESLTAGSHHAEWFGGVIERFFAEIDNPAIRGQNLQVATICANVLAAARAREEILT